MSDLELLEQYTRDNSQAAFAEVVHRYVDLVYSAAHRQVRSPQLAQEVAQSVFVDLAQHATRLRRDQPLAAWLFVVTRRTAVDVVRRESRRQTREQTAVEIAALKTPSPTWAQVKDVLDEAIESLNDAERTALLLRFFENRSLREVGESLGTSEDTAQKRVSRALDRLRTLLLRRGVAVSGVALATDLSAHAVEAAPAGLATTIASASGTAAFATLAAVTAKTAHTAASFAPKAIAAAATAAVLGFVGYETTVLLRQRAKLTDAPRQVADARALLQSLATARQAAATRLAAARTARTQADHVLPATDPEVERAIEAWLQRLSRLRQLAAERAELAIPELAALSENEWFGAAREAQFETEEQIRATFRKLHQSARQGVGRLLHRALISYADSSDGRTPESLATLVSHLSPRLPAAVLERYELLWRGTLSAAPADEWILAERMAVVSHDSGRLFVTAVRSDLEDLATISDREFRRALQAYATAHGGRMPETPEQLAGFFAPPPRPEALAEFLARPAADFTGEALRRRLDPP